MLPLTTVSIAYSNRRTDRDSHFDGENGSNNARSYFAEWFVTDFLGLRAQYADGGSSLDFGDVDIWEFGVTGRFGVSPASAKRRSWIFFQIGQCRQQKALESAVETSIEGRFGVNHG